tara:strand:- start:128 stop:334 length:207 start_codon:yes stop_codon:yes gene_type:complete
MNQFLYTCETPNKFVGGDVYSNDLESIENYALECGEEYGYSIVRNNVTGEIVFEYGDQLMQLIEDGII